MHPDSSLSWLIALAVVALFVAVFVVGQIMEKKRREALEVAAGALSLAFAPGRDDLRGERYRALNLLSGGDNHYAESVISGQYSGEEVECFDFHYETYSTDSKGKRRTNHHWHHVFALDLPKSFPELTIGPENIFTRLAKNFGFQSIDFESAEFSRTFLVRSPDKKFAYDVCHARMMEYLLANRDLGLEIDGVLFALIFPGRMLPEAIRGNLDRLVALRQMLPGYLFDR